MDANKTPRDILKYFFVVLFKRKRLILLLFFITLFSFIFGTFLVSPQWKATAKILVLQNPKQQMILFKDLAAPSLPEKNYAEDLVEILTGREIGAQIVREFQLDELKRQKAQNPKKIRDKIKLLIVSILKSPLALLQKIGILKKKPPNFFASALEDFLENMQDVSVEKGTNTINLTIWGEFPVLAVKIVDSMVNKLMEKTKQFVQSEASKTYTFTKNQVDSLLAAVKSSEDELVKFKDKEKISDLGEQKNLILMRVNNLYSELDTTQKNLFSFKAKLLELKKQIASQPKLILEKEVTGQSDTYVSLKKELNKNEMDLAGLTNSFKPGHPEFSGLENTIRVNKEKLESEDPFILLNKSEVANAIRQELEKEKIQTEASIAELEAKIVSIRKILSRLEKELFALNKVEIKLERYNRQLQGLKDRYANLFDKALELEVQQYTEISEIDLKVSDPAYIPEGAQPDRPSWILNILVALVMGVFLSIGGAFIVEYYNDRIVLPQDLQNTLGIKVLGTIPPLSLNALGTTNDNLSI